MEKLIVYNARMQNPKLNIPITLFFLTLYVLAFGGFIYLFLYGIKPAEAIYHLTAYLIGGFGITALYHRVWTHNAATFQKPLEIFMAIAATLFIQGSGKLWVNDHIQHHQHTDKEDDPYNIQRGFWWAHHDWIIFRKHTEIRLPARLQNNAVFQWQHRWYWQLSFTLNILIPTVLSLMAGSPWFAGIILSALRIMVCNHIVWCINSICHTFGSRKFTKDVSARDVWWFPFTLGEQYHNYHHAFPRDYRNGIAKRDFDPTKWFIWASSKLGLASNLFSMPEEKVEQARTRAAATINDKPLPQPTPHEPQ